MRERRKKIQSSEMLGKSRGVVPTICGSGGSKSRLAKGRVRSHVVRGEIKDCTPLGHDARFHSRTTFGSWDFKKLHAAVARSTFANTHHVPTILEVRMSRNGTLLWREAHLQTHTMFGPFWKLGCQKIAGRCDAKTFATQMLRN